MLGRHHRGREGPPNWPKGCFYKLGGKLGLHKRAMVLKVAGFLFQLLPGNCVAGLRCGGKMAECSFSPPLEGYTAVKLQSVVHAQWFLTCVKK